MMTSLQEPESAAQSLRARSIYIAVSSIILLAGIATWWNMTSQYAEIGSDFVQDYISGVALREGKSIYGDTISELAERVIGERNIQNFHPPFMALFFLPSSYISFPNAFVLLNSCSLVLYLWIIYEVLRDDRWKPTTRYFITALSLFWFPFITCIGSGQSSLFITAGVVIGWWMLERKHHSAAGFFFSGSRH